MIRHKIQVAYHLHKEGNLTEALRQYDEILKTNPKHFDVLHLRGLVSHEIASFLEAEKYFTTAIEVKPDFSQIYLSYAQTLIDLNRLDDALICYQKAISINPSDPDSYFDRGVVLKRLKKFHDAFADFETTIAHRHDDAMAYNNRGVVLGELNRLCEAIQSYEIAITLDPTNAFAYSNKASALKAMGQSYEAVKSFDIAIILEPHHADFYFNKANSLIAMNNLTEARKTLDKAIEMNPTHADAAFSRGNTYHYSHFYSEAIADYETAIILRPDHAKVYSSRGEALRAINQLDESLNSFNRAIIINSNFYQAYFNRANVLKWLARNDQALISYDKAIANNKEYAEAFYNRGILLRELNRNNEALESYERAIIINPAYSDAILNHGILVMETSLYEKALDSFAKVIALRPDCAEAFNNQGIAYHNQRNLGQALLSYKKAVSVRQDYPEVFLNLGVILMEMNQLDEALIVYENAIILKPDYAHAYNNRALTLKEAKRFNEALASCDQAIAIIPDYSEAYNNFGIVLKEISQLNEAIACFKKAISNAPDYFTAHSNLLFTLNYMEDVSVVERMYEARRFGSNVTQKTRNRFTAWNNISNNGKIRIGFVSGDFQNHPVGYFLEGLVSNIDCAKFDLIGYTTDMNEDDLTRRLKSKFQLWRSLCGQQDFAAAKQVHDDGINILIDLSGHTAKNRLPVFGYKPAPVQISWLGYFATTGVNEIDYFLGDPYVTPLEEEHHFCETIKQLPETYLCFTPPEAQIEVAALPALENGYVTFGSFNNFSKINSDVINLWARVLHAVAGSRLFMKAAQLKDPDVVEDIRKQFQSCEIAEDRLIFEGQTDRMDYFKAYNRVDIALDPFPYPGGTTSVEGLWMGVPVIAKKGNRFIAHNGETIAHNSGQSHWISRDDDDYVKKAKTFSSDLQALAVTRASLRHQVMESPLFDSERFARHFEQTMIEIWQDYRNKS